MEKNDLPESFGVFKPVGHIVIAFRTAVLMEAAATALLARDFTPADLFRFTPEEMKTQVDRDLETASPMASLGQDLNLVKAHGVLAEQGCSFLVVHAPDDAHADRVAEVLKSVPAESAQRYGHFVIEELPVGGADEPQVFESPERGLDTGAAAHGRS